MTESCTTLTWFPLSQRIGTPGSAGHLLPGVVARVVREDGTLVPRRIISSYSSEDDEGRGGRGILYGGTQENESGELQVRAPSLALGYWKNETACV